MQYLKIFNTQGQNRKFIDIFVMESLDSIS